MRESRGEKATLKSAGASADAIIKEYANGLGIFMSGEFEQLNRNVTTFEDGYDSSIWRLTAGTDYQFTQRFVAGLAFDYYSHNGSFTGGGDFHIDSYGILGFATLLPVDNVFIQISGGLERKDYDRSRVAALTDTRATSGEIVPVTSGLARGRYSGNDLRVGVLAGYEHSILNLSIGPRFGLDWAGREFNSYREEGMTGLELQVAGDKQMFFQSRLGVQALLPFKTRFAVFVPQASVDWKHEFSNDQRNVQVSFVGDMRAKRFVYQTESPDRDWVEINAGVSAVLRHGLQSYVNYRVLVGHSFFDSHAGTIGLRYTF